jgi:hypothetical protein
MAPKAGQTPTNGIRLTFGVSLLRSGLTFFYATGSRAALPRLEDFGLAPVPNRWVV